jgi:hypothetical protein
LPSGDAQEDPGPCDSAAGRFGEHHALLARMHLEHIDHLSGDDRGDGAPIAAQEGLLCTIPGIAQRTAQVLIGEIGV